MSVRSSFIPTSNCACVAGQLGEKISNCKNQGLSELVDFKKSTIAVYRALSYGLLNMLRFFWDTWYEQDITSKNLRMGFLKSVHKLWQSFYFNRGLQRPYTGTCIIFHKTINGFLCLLILSLKSKFEGCH